LDLSNRVCIQCARLEPKSGKHLRGKGEEEEEELIFRRNFASL